MSLKQIREAKGLTQKEVAVAIGCTPLVYSRYERGLREPSIEMLLRLADVFGISTDTLLGRQPIESSILSAIEIELVEAARESDIRATRDAITLLRSHKMTPGKKGSLVASAHGPASHTIHWTRSKSAFFLNNAPKTHSSFFHTPLHCSGKVKGVVVLAGNHSCYYKLAAKLLSKSAIPGFSKRESSKALSSDLASS